MPNILIGQELSEDLFRINAQLRANTVREYNDQSAIHSTFYSPWLCIFPALNGQKLPQSILCQPTFEKGGLVTDRKFLSDTREFMKPITELTRNGIYDQKHIDWIPITDVAPQSIELFAAGRVTLLKASPMFSRMYLELVDYVLPLAGQRNRGYSVHLARGIILRAVPDNADKFDIAIDLAHELGHHALMVLQSVDSILESDPAMPIYSQIRRTLRPAIQTFHAAMALAFMHMFVETMSSDLGCKAAGERRGKSYTDTLQNSLRLSIKSLRAECRFTELGNTILNEMQAIA
jgi:hypothetical protein